MGRRMKKVFVETKDNKIYELGLSWMEDEEMDSMLRTIGQILKNTDSVSHLENLQYYIMDRTLSEGLLYQGSTIGMDQMKNVWMEEESDDK